MRWMNVSQSISIWSKSLGRKGRKLRRNLRNKLKIWGLRVCKSTQILKLRCRMIFRICKSVMRKWRLSINLTLRSWITIWKFWRRRGNRTSIYLNSTRKNSECITSNSETSKTNTKNQISCSRIPTNFSQLSTRGLQGSSRNSKESSSTSKNQIWKDITKSRQWMRQRCTNTSKRSLSAMLWFTTSSLEWIGQEPLKRRKLRRRRKMHLRLNKINKIRKLTLL